jgi:hypothetical protein
MARGLIEVASELSTHGSAGGNIPQPGESGWAHAYAQSAGSLGQISNEIGRLADHVAAKEGAAAGREAGLDPEFRTQGVPTIRAEAFDKAGLDVAETRLKSAVDVGLQDLYEKHSADPAALARGIDQVSTGILTGAPEELRPKLGLLLEAKRLGYMRDAARQQMATQRSEQTAALQTELSDGLAGLHRDAYKLGLDTKADTVLAGRVGDLEAVMRRTGVDGKPLIDPKVAERYLAHARDTIVEARLLGTMDRLETPEQKAEMIRKFEADWKAGTGVAKQFDLDRYRSMRSLLEGELRRSEAGRSVTERALLNDVKGVASLAEAGYAPRPDDIARIKAEVARSGHPELAAMMSAAEGALSFTSGARRATPAQLERWVEDEEARLRGTDGASHAEVARLEAARKLVGTMRAELKKDPNGWADRVGLIKVDPLDLSSPDGLSASLSRRVVQAEAVGDMYDQPPRYLREDEKRRLQAMAAPGGKALLDVVGTISKSAGGNAPKIMAELFDKGRGTLAIVGAHVADVGTTPVAQDVADGVALRRTKDFKSLQPLSRYARAWSAEAHGGALAGLPQSEQALIDATNYAYDVRLQGKHQVENRSLWVSTFRELLGERKIDGTTYGGVTTWRGHSVVVPTDVKQDEFGDLVKSIRIEDFGDKPPMTGSGPASVADIRAARLVPVGNGRYRMNLGDDDTPQWLVDGERRPFVLDLGAIKGKLIERRPDLYLDGASRAKRPFPAPMKLGGPVEKVEGEGVPSWLVKPPELPPLRDGEVRPKYPISPDDPADGHYQGGGLAADLDDEDGSLEKEAWDAVDLAAREKWGREMFPDAERLTPGGTDELDALNRRKRGGPGMKQILDNAWEMGVPMDMIERYIRNQGIEGWKPPGTVQPKSKRPWRKDDIPQSRLNGGTHGSVG